MNASIVKLLVVSLFLCILPVLSEKNEEPNQLANENSRQNLDVDGSVVEGKDKRYRLYGKRSNGADENISQENEISKRYRLYGKRTNEDALEAESDSNEEMLEKRYRLMGKRYRLMGKRYRLMGKRENEDQVSENDSIEKRYRLYGKRYRLYGKRNNLDEMNELNSNEREIIKRYRLHG